ncbi:MAG: 50S ribosomal protein L4 [Candidatus Sungbacteria bacterium]|uniref:Large ribosomal subunit protein uL4 n=1 Tax=Candidatus Sungiibacteriota bacterium TaxID=2750080 RepID=A0A931SCR3_9BACT|nr:50S ribosomal protein L4 [Candidatus Sungbacteria bacterium]
MKLPVFDQSGKELEAVEAPQSLFDAPLRRDLLHQVVTAQSANARRVLASTKDRAQVRGGGRKPWRQKGTGRARHGSIRSPLWRGGGVTHGPRKERNLAKKLNKGMATAGLAMALSAKARDAEVVLLKGLALTSGKTKEAFDVVKKLATHKSLTALARKSKILLLPDGSLTETRAFRNIDELEVRPAASVTAREVLAHRYVLIPLSAVAVLEKRVTKRA